MGCETSKNAEILTNTVASSPLKKASVKLTKSRTLGSPKLTYKNDVLAAKSQLRTVPPLELATSGQRGTVMDRSVILKKENDIDSAADSQSTANERNSSAVSQISNISTG